MIRVEATGPEPGGAAFGVWCAPGASREGIRGERDGALRVAVTAPAEKGRANEAIVRLLARALGLRPGDLSIRSGRAARAKRIVVRSVGVEALRGRLLRLLEDGHPGREDEP